MNESKEGDFFGDNVTLADIARRIPGRVDNLKHLAQGILTVMHREQIPAIRYELNSPLENFETDKDGDIILPGDKISFGTDTIIIHGIRHSVLGYGIMPQNKKLTEYVRKYVAKTSEKGELWITEEGLDQDFGIKSDRSLTYIDQYIDKKMEGKDFEKMNLKQKIKEAGSLIKGQAKDLFDVLNTLTYNRDDFIKKVILETEKKLKTDPRYLLKYLKLVDLASLPQPLDMEIGIVLASKGNLRKPNFVIDRSNHQAREIEDYLKSMHFLQKKRTPVTAHVLCGDIHRTQISFFLTHPDYDIRKSIESTGKPLVPTGVSAPFAT